MSSTTLAMVDGTQIVVPDSLELITPYVLREQQDWFEDEIKFLRRLLQPGQQIIDIGANYGLYALSMARRVGPEGRVWAFEPASRTAEFLARSIAANGLGNVVLEKSALSSAPGTAYLSLHDNAELNELVRGDAGGAATEAVPLTTLDDCLQRHGWQDIDFMKIDAEGEEANILKGGQRFFAERSPLVEYEVKAGNDLHLELVSAFAALGYESYRLVPGLDLLVPFRADTRPDGFLLNLFCCKPDRAARLAAAGFLVPALPDPAAPAPQPAPRHGWREALAPLPYAAALRGAWEGSPAPTAGALALYAMSRDATLSAGERFHALQASYLQLSQDCAGPTRGLALLSLARVARDYGARSVAVQSLNALAKRIVQEGRADVAEAFLAASPRFEQIGVELPRLGNWLLGSIFEELERLGSFSSFYTGSAAKARLENIARLGFGSAEMQRRLQLLNQRIAAA